MDMFAVLLGYGCLVGSCFRSVPQIAIILKSGSAEGLSLTSNLVELLCFTVTVAYNMQQVRVRLWGGRRRSRGRRRRSRRRGMACAARPLGCCACSSCGGLGGPYLETAGACGEGPPSRHPVVAGLLPL